MAREYIKEAEEILGKKFSVLDYGFIRLVDYMGGDKNIVDAARVSYGHQEIKKTPEDDRRLIRRLMRDKHTSPFEMVEILYHVKLPIFVARQWIRHRTANVNEISGRYSELPNEFYVPNELRIQDKSNKQGSNIADVNPEIKQEMLNILIDQKDSSYGAYQELLGKGLAREMARMPLGLGVYTEWYWKIDLHNNFNFLRLRMADDAQWEIRQYANTMGEEIVKKIAPVAYEAFKDYVLESLTLSRVEKEIIKYCLMNNTQINNDELKKGYGLAQSEREQLPLKFEELGLGKLIKDE